MCVCVAMSNLPSTPPPTTRSSSSRQHAPVWQSNWLGHETCWSTWASTLLHSGRALPTGAAGRAIPGCPQGTIAAPVTHARRGPPCRSAWRPVDAGWNTRAPPGGTARQRALVRRATAPALAWGPSVREGSGPPQVVPAGAAGPPVVMVGPLRQATVLLPRAPRSHPRLGRCTCEPPAGRHTEYATLAKSRRRALG